MKTFILTIQIEADITDEFSVTPKEASDLLDYLEYECYKHGYSIYDTNVKEETV
jgi:hypothetical protein